MEPRKRTRRGTAPSRVASGSSTATDLPLANIAALIDHGGQITLGALQPIKCVAIANEDRGCLAMLQRRSAETVPQLLGRLDTARARLDHRNAHRRDQPAASENNTASVTYVKMVSPGRLLLSSLEASRIRKSVARST